LKLAGPDACQRHRRKKLGGEIHGDEKDPRVAIRDQAMKPAKIYQSIDAKDHNQDE